MALHTDVRELASRFFPEAAAVTSSPPLDMSMGQLQRQMEALNACCDEPRVRASTAGLSGMSATPFRTPQPASSLQRDLVDEAEVSWQ